MLNLERLASGFQSMTSEFPFADIYHEKTITIKTRKGLDVHRKPVAIQKVLPHPSELSQEFLRELTRTGVSTCAGMKGRLRINTSEIKKIAWALEQDGKLTIETRGSLEIYRVAP